MSTIIKDTAGKVIDLPTDFQTEIEITSPIFEPTGSGSNPIVLPSTPANDIRFGYAGNSGRAGHPNTRIDVTVDEDNSIRNGVLALAEVTDTGDYDCTILFDESDFYGKIAETKLGEMSGLPVVETETVSGMVAALKHIYRKMEVWPGEPFFLVPDWWYEVNVYPAVVSIGDDSKLTDPTKWRWINELDTTSTESMVNIIGEHPFTVTETNNGTTSVVNYPQGYGMSPFLKLHRVIHYVMQFCGYTVVENIFATDLQLKEANVLNNVMDIICDGRLDYADMMPDCTIDDFRQFLKARFGAFIFINTTDKTARIKLFKDLIKETPIDYTTAKGGKPKISMPTKKGLKLSAGKSFAPSATSHETFEEMLKRWDSTIPTFDAGAEAASYQLLVYHLKTTGNYYLKSAVVNDPPTLYSSPFFTYDKKDTTEFEEWSSPDEQVTMVNRFWDFMAPLYLAGRRHKKTSFVGVSDSETEDGSDTPLSICFAKGRAIDAAGGPLNFYWGSILAVNNQGNGLTPDFYFDFVYQGTLGLMNAFLKDYDACLRAAFESYTQKLNLTSIQRNLFDTSRPMLVDNQLYLIEKLTWTTGKTTTDALMRSIRLLHDVTAEQAVPEVSEPLYEWIPWNNKTEVINAKYAIENAANKTTVNGTLTIKSTEAPSISDFKFLKYPTADDFNSNKIISFDYGVVINIHWVHPEAETQENYDYHLTYQSGVIAALI